MPFTVPAGMRQRLGSSPLRKQKGCGQNQLRKRAHAELGLELSAQCWRRLVAHAGTPIILMGFSIFNSSETKPVYEQLRRMSAMGTDKFVPCPLYPQ